MNPHEYAERRRDAYLAKASGLTEAAETLSGSVIRALADGQERTSPEVEWSDYLEEAKPFRGGPKGVRPRYEPAWAGEAAHHALSLFHVDEVNDALGKLAEAVWAYSMLRDDVVSVNRDADELRKRMSEEGILRHPLVSRLLTPVSAEDAAEGARLMRSEEPESA